ncbi:MAG: carboxypeptidase-like regulatory domain-containing protein, partial [Candidatus Onthomonas sp.]|nr:carboxypeptidase-like regulatory domain-containing protein [Candidatus Onthomonas sp.]
MGKKLLRAALLAAALVLVLTTAAFAVEGNITVVDGVTEKATASWDGVSQYTVTYTDAAIAGKQCVLLVVAGTYDGSTPTYTISESTIQYIDQTAADSSGSVSFTYIPKSTPDSLVLLGIEGQSGPILLATVESKGVTVSGSVSFRGDFTKATVSLTAGSDVFSVETASGAYEIASVPDGTYTLSITKKGHLPYSTTVTVDADNTALGSVTLLGGDVDSDHRFINAS